MATICGNTVSTAAQINGKQDPTSGKITLDYTKFTMAPGDGVVTYDSCQMHSGFQFSSIASGKDHFDLLNDFTAVGQALQSLGSGCYNTQNMQAMLYTGTANSTSSSSSSWWGGDGDGDSDDSSGSSGDTDSDSGGGGGWSSWW